MSYVSEYLAESAALIVDLSTSDIENAIDLIVRLKKNAGNLFIIGLGGSAAHASHAVADFRKMCGLNAFCPTDNIAYLTAQINDHGWERCFSNWLESHNACDEDVLMVFSVGGGEEERGISLPIIDAVNYAKARELRIIGITGSNGGYTAENADVCIRLPKVKDPNYHTGHTEGICSVIWHLMVNHPKLRFP